jgi:CYTH domain-containing protein
MDAEETKYSRVEYERRFLVSPRTNWRSVVEPYSKRFEDRYLRNSRLRLRLLTDSDTGRQIIKLNKKFDSDSPYFQTVSRILLSQREYQLFDGMEGDRISKIRHYHNYLGRVFSIDVFEGELDGLVLCETEADNLDELLKARPPEYTRQEVTEDAFFRGGNLCRTTRAELLGKLTTFG